MNAAKALLKTGIGLLEKGAHDIGMYGRMIRLTGQALFALGRSGLDTFIEPETNQKWLKASGDLERDGLLQSPLRDLVVEFKHTKPEHFKAVFAGRSSLLLHKSARSFFREIRNKRLERERIACLSLAYSCLILAEDRYSVETHSLQEYLEQKSVKSELIRTQDDLINFTALTSEFIDIQQQLRAATADRIGNVFSAPDATPAPKELTS